MARPASEPLPPAFQTSGIVSPTAKETGWCPKIWDPESGPSVRAFCSLSIQKGPLDNSVSCPLQFRDISQNYKADDCGLLSAAASMALINPDAVKQAIPQPECGASPEVSPSGGSLCSFKKAGLTQHRTAPMQRLRCMTGIFRGMITILLLPMSAGNSQ